MNNNYCKEVEEKLEKIIYPAYIIIRGDERYQSIWFEYESIYRAEYVENSIQAINLFNSTKNSYQGPDYHLNITIIRAESNDCCPQEGCHIEYEEL